MTSVRLLVLALALAAASATGASAQELYYELKGANQYDDFGFDVAFVGDVDKDGFDDLAVGAPGNSYFHIDGGAVYVYSGVDGSLLYEFWGIDIRSDLGESVDGAGDVDRDGYPDITAAGGGDTTYGEDTGFARAWSGRDGSVLYTFYGDAGSPGDLMQTAAGAGDVDADGFADLVVGSQWDDKFGHATGSAKVFSGRDGELLWEFTGDSANDYMYPVDSAGDVDADGHADVILGAPEDGPSSGSAQVRSGSDGSLLFYVYGTGVQQIGSAVAGVGDLDRDGFSDFAYGARHSDTFAPNAGEVRVHSGQTGALLYTFHGAVEDEYFGDSVSGGGDLDGDGVPDVLAGNHPFGGGVPGLVRGYSGIDGELLFEIEGSASFGNAVDVGGDLNGDGVADFLVGERAAGAGAVSVFLGLCPVSDAECGPAVENSSGRPARLFAHGSEVALDNDLRLRAVDLAPGHVAMAIASQTAGFVQQPAGSQGNLCLGGAIVRFSSLVATTSAYGTAGFAIDLTSFPSSPPHTVVAGETWYFQVWFRDQNPQATSNFTDAARVAFE